MYPFDKFAFELQKNIPNQNSKGISELLDNLSKDPKGTVDLAEKAELLLLGKFKENTWNNGSVARYGSMQKHTDAFIPLILCFRNGCSLLLKLLEPLLSSERFAEINEHVQKYSWHRWDIL